MLLLLIDTHLQFFFVCFSSFFFSVSDVCRSSNSIDQSEYFCGPCDWDICANCLIAEREIPQFAKYASGLYIEEPG
jgi:hypothetical protein